MLISEIPEAALYVVGAILGLLFGSFLNVVVHRLPRNENIAFPPSTCPQCGAAIAAYDNVPVLSWVLLRGKARCCGGGISGRYPLIELLGGLIALAIMRQLVLPNSGDLSWYAGLCTFALYLALGLGLLAALFIDLEWMILPDVLTLGGALLGVLSIPIRDISWLNAAIGGVFGYVLVWAVFHHGYRLLRGQPGMGLGDAKLLLLAGVWFGWEGALFAVMAGAVQGTVFALVVYLVQGKIEEPAGVRREREELEQELAQMDEAERLQLEKELEGDLLLDAPGSGFTGARLAFGPFLVLAILEFLFLRPWLSELFNTYLLV